MRVLWVSNAPWAPSGYGEQTALFVPRIAQLGHEVAVAANYGLQAKLDEWEGFRVYPTDGQWNNTTLELYAKHWNADLVLVLHDAWPMKPDVWGDVPPVAIWAPVDHYPIPPAVLATLQHERVRPVAMSRFGERLMEQFRLEPLYVPHAVDTKLFRPRPEIRASVREELGLPVDAFIVGMVAANKGNPSLPRKSFGQAFEAFRRFTQTHDDAWLYVHSEAESRQGSGIDLGTLGHVLGLQDRLRFPPPAIWHLPTSREVLANLYAAFDVLLNPSMGEGFGVPLLEAQASGVPVIASDHSSMTELCRYGWLVSGDPWWDALQESFLIVPFIDSIVNALEAAYYERDNTGAREAAAEWAQAYDAHRVAVEYWDPVLEALGGPVEVPPLKPNRAMRRRQRVRA